MKTTKIYAACFAFCTLVSLNTNAQWYGQLHIAHDSTVLSSAKHTVISPGYVMAGFRPERQTIPNTSPDFVIDQVDAAGLFVTPPFFSNDYQVQTALDCSNGTQDINSCVGISIIEIQNRGNNERYAIAGAYDQGIFFATLDPGGNIINKNFWAFPSVDVNSRKPIIRASSTSGEYYICGKFMFQAYVMRVDFNGTQLWGNIYDGWILEPRDIVEATSRAELIVVGRTDLNPYAACPFFMNLDAFTGAVNYCNFYNLGAYDTDDWFSCVEIASSPTGGRGYVLGGRCYSASVGNITHDQWMCKLDLNGNVVWSSLIEPGAHSTTLLVGEEIVRVKERRNYNGTFEYYGVGESYYFMSGSSLIQTKNLVVFKLDDNGSNSLNPNEFHYVGGGHAPGTPSTNSPYRFADLSLIETGGGPDDGIQAFGTSLNSFSHHYFVKAYFNGVSGCKEDINKISAIYPGPTLVGTLNPNVTPVFPCGPQAINFNVFSNNPQVNSVCYAPSDPNGSNARTMATGISATGTENDMIHVYPNPVNQVLTVTAPSKAIITIYNTLGQKITEYTVSDESAGDVKMDLSTLHIKAGFYSVQVSTATTKNSYKIVYEPK